MNKEAGLKLVILYDAGSNQYSVLNHNLSTDEAQQQSAPAECATAASPVVIAQRKRHKTTDPQDCRACREDVRRVLGAQLNTQAKFKRRNQ